MRGVGKSGARPPRARSQIVWEEAGVGAKERRSQGVTVRSTLSSFPLSGGVTEGEVEAGEAKFESGRTFIADVRAAVGAVRRSGDMATLQIRIELPPEEVGLVREREGVL